MQDFVHLHLHTQYSLLDGAADINVLLDKAVELGMKEIAITDHGVMYGAIEFYDAAISRGIKPIIGCEVYTASRSRFDKDASLDKHYGHLILLCKNEIGYRNLITLVTKAQTEGFYYRPRIDMELLKEHSEGLIALSACLRGDVPTSFLRYGYDAALVKVNEYASVFGKDNYFLEIQNHGIPEEDEVRDALIKISKETGIGLVATNDVHYVSPEDAMLQDVLMCIQTGKKLSDTDRMKMEGEEFYLKSGNEMKDLFADCPQALLNTKKIADMCNLTIDTDTLHLPSISINSSLSHEDYLYQLCIEGMRKKYKEITPELTERLNYELSVINKMGYTDYFLIVHDFIDYSRKNGISVGPGRGSAAGSLCAYCLDITQIDPIEYNLLFERFLNPERVSMPDIDIDFCYRRRDEVRSYVAKKYGESRVAQIVTFGTLAARAAIKDVGRVLGVSLATTNMVSKAVPGVLHIKLKDAIDASKELSQMYRTDPEIKKLLDIAQKLEGFPRNTSTHAAGVVIGDDDLTRYVPLQSCDTGLLTQYPMSSLEKIGLLKMDFLGIRNLTIIEDTVRLIKEKHNIDIDIDNIPLDDKKTFELISSGDTDAVFQLENSGLQTFLRRFKPTKFEDIITTTSIYRPGPMEQIPTFLENVNNPEKISYAHPLLEPILESTYGVTIYQEQVMKIVRSLAGYSFGRADLVRRAMSKKKQKEMLKERNIFINGLSENGEVIVEGAVRRGVDETTANEIFDSLIDFANYAFNKSHAACYALVAYRTAWLKTHFPTFYLAAVLQSYAGNVNKAVKYLSSFAKYGIKLLVPDINKSFTHFIPEGNNVRFGLCWLKNVGERFPEQIVEERNKNGNFISFEDFIKRMSAYDINKRSVEILIKCGAFDSIYPNRRVLIFNSERLIDKHISHSRIASTGQLDWFSSFDDEKSEEKLLNDNYEDFTKEDKLSFEYEFSNMYFSGHPLDAYRLKIRAISDATIAEICENSDFADRKVTICGRISGISTRRTKSGKSITTMSFSDFSGSCNLVVFENTMARYSSYIFDGAPVCITANVSFGDDEKETELVLNTLSPLPTMQIPPSKTLYIRVENKVEFESLKPIFNKFSGLNPLCIRISDTNEVLRSDLSHGVFITDSLINMLCERIGEENIYIK